MARGLWSGFKAKNDRIILMNAATSSESLWYTVDSFNLDSIGPNAAVSTAARLNISELIV
jgi:hypothetical protein